MNRFKDKLFIGTLAVALIVLASATVGASGFGRGHMGNYMGSDNAVVTGEENSEGNYPGGYKYEVAEEDIDEIVKYRLDRHEERLSYQEREGIITEDQKDVYLDIKEDEIRNRLENYEGDYGRSPSYHRGHRSGFGRGHMGVGPGSCCY